jgi:hypothetical protein
MREALEDESKYSHVHKVLLLLVGIVHIETRCIEQNTLWITLCTIGILEVN